MSVLSVGQFYGQTTTRHESAGVAISRLDHFVARKLPMHVHEQAFFSMVLDGSYREETGRRAIDYDPLTIVYHPPGTAHVDEIGPSGVRFLMIEAHDDLLLAEDLSARLSSGFPVALSPGMGRVALQLLRFHDPLTQESIALELLSAVGDGEAPIRAPGWLPRVLDQVRDEFVDPPKVRELARKAGIHPVHLARVVRRHTGSTLAGLVRHRRVEYSWSLLRTNRPLAAIALRAGFSDQAHFTRAFKSVTGFTPAEVRRLLR